MPDFFNNTGFYQVEISFSLSRIFYYMHLTAQPYDFALCLT